MDITIQAAIWAAAIGVGGVIIGLVGSVWASSLQLKRESEHQSREFERSRCDALIDEIQSFTTNLEENFAKDSARLITTEEYDIGYLRHSHQIAISKISKDTLLFVPHLYPQLAKWIETHTQWLTQWGVFVHEAHQSHVGNLEPATAMPSFHLASKAQLELSRQGVALQMAIVTHIRAHYLSKQNRELLRLAAAQERTKRPIAGRFVCWGCLRSCRG